MTEEPVVEFDLELLEVDIRRAYRWMFLRPRKSRRVLWFFWFIGFTFPLLYLVLVVISGLEFYLPVLLISLIPTILWILAFVGNEYLARHYLKGSKLRQEFRHCRFTSEGFETKGQLSDTHIRWDAFREAIETKRDFFLFISDAEFCLIPKQAFPDAVTEKAFTRLLLAHIHKVELRGVDEAAPKVHLQ